MSRNDFDSEDLRVKRTHKLLQEALIELTIQKGFSAIAVSDITKYAGVNRATFYRHYEDKFDLLNQYVQRVYKLLEASPEDRPSASSEVNTRQTQLGLITIFEHIQANAKFYRVMLGKNGDPVFGEKIRQYIRDRIWRSLPPEQQKNDDSVDLYLSYSSSASVGAVLWWLEHDMPYTAEQMATISYKIGATLSILLEQPQLYEVTTRVNG
jgi:AcrR family transcriptional regulator